MPRFETCSRDGVAGIVVTDEVDGRVLTCEGPIAQVYSSAWTAGPDSTTGTPRLARRPLVPAEVSDTVQQRHEDGRRIVLEMEIQTARMSRALEPDR